MSMPGFLVPVLLPDVFVSWSPEELLQGTVRFMHCYTFHRVWGSYFIPYIFGGIHSSGPPRVYTHPPLICLSSRKLPFKWCALIVVLSSPTSLISTRYFFMRKLLRWAWGSTLNLAEDKCHLSSSKCFAFCGEMLMWITCWLTARVNTIYICARFWYLCVDDHHFFENFD